MNLNFTITNDHIKLASLSERPVSDSMNHLTAVFEFDEAWDGFTKTAVFSGCNSCGKSVSVKLENDSCVIPWETLTGHMLSVSVFGNKGDVRITSSVVKIPLDKSGYCEGEAPEAPTPTVYEQLLAELERIDVSGLEAKDSELQGQIENIRDEVQEEIQQTQTSVNAKITTINQCISDEKMARQYADEALSAEIDTKIAEAKSIIPKRYLVTELPTEGIDTNGTYLVPAETPNTDNIYTEYANINGKWEIIGSPFEVDLSGYATEEYVSTVQKTLNQSVSDEGMARQTADEELSETIKQEATAREEADTALSEEIDTKQDAVKIGTLEVEDDTGNTVMAETVVLEHNTVYYSYLPAEVLNVEFPDFVNSTFDPETYISSFIFESLSPATALTYPSEIIMSGDDCIDGVFTPIENKRYEVIVWYDGMLYKGVVRGDSI